MLRKKILINWYMELQQNDKAVIDGRYDGMEWGNWTLKDIKCVCLRKPYECYMNTHIHFSLTEYYVAFS